MPFILTAKMNKTKEQAIKSDTKFVWSTGKSYSKELGLVVTFFILMVTISNITYRLFGFKLLPFFELTFDAFHDFCHYILHLLIFSWLTFILQSIWLGLTTICSWFLPIIPKWPKIIIPSLITDLALVSLAFTRVFQSVDIIIPRSEREIAENNMTTELWKDIEKAEGSFWGPLHRSIERINIFIWNLIDSIHRILIYPIRKFPKLSLFVKRTLIALAGSILMWGFIRLAGYLINVSAARHLDSPTMSIRKRFFRYFILNLIGAIVATAIFIVLNGWLAEWTAPNK